MDLNDDLVEEMSYNQKNLKIKNEDEYFKENDCTCMTNVEKKLT